MNKVKAILEVEFEFDPIEGETVEDLLASVKEEMLCYITGTEKVNIKRYETITEISPHARDGHAPRLSSSGESED